MTVYDFRLYAAYAAGMAGIIPVSVLLYLLLKKSRGVPRVVWKWCTGAHIPVINRSYNINILICVVVLLGCWLVAVVVAGCITQAITNEHTANIMAGAVALLFVPTVTLLCSTIWWLNRTPKTKLPKAVVKNDRKTTPSTGQ